MAEHSTADREVPGSNLGTPFFFLIFVAHIILKLEHNRGVRSGSS